MRKTSRVVVTSRSDVAVSISRACCSIYRMLPNYEPLCVYFTRITTKVTLGYVENIYYLTFGLQTLNLDLGQSTLLAVIAFIDWAQFFCLQITRCLVMKMCICLFPNVSFRRPHFYPKLRKTISQKKRKISRTRFCSICTYL